MSNSACLSSSMSSPTLEHHGHFNGSPSMPQNLLALSLLLSSLGCNSTHQQDSQRNLYQHDVEDSANSFRYMQQPLAKISDITESSRKLVQFTEREFLKKEVVKVGQNIHVAIGYALANSIMIEGKDGIVIVDTTESGEAMAEILDEFRKITAKPVKAIVLTHFHTDHILGTYAILEREEKLRPGVSIQIMAHESTITQMLGYAATYDIGYKRGHRQFGSLLPRILGAITGSGIGPYLRAGRNVKLHIPFPTATYKDRKTYQVGGLEFELIHTPGETSDQTTIWFPNEKAVLPADNIYKAFPNLYAIRGSPTRNAKVWYTSLDKTRQLGAEYLVGSHGQPIVGKQAVYDTLLIYRDAIKYVHDQTLRLLNKGYFPNKIVETIVLPDALADHPYLEEHYGTVAWSIRGIYTSYLGWFSGDPKDLHPLNESARAKKMMKLIADSSNQQRDPAEIMLQHAQMSHENSYKTYLKTGRHDLDDDKWALEIVDMLLESNSLTDNLIHAANQIKISALRAIGSEEISANGRNYYMTYAMEVESAIPHVIDSSGIRKDSIKTSPVKRVIDMICSRVNGLHCQHDNYTVSLSFTDTEATYTMTLRNSVCDVFHGIAKRNDIHLHTTAENFKSTILGELEIDDMVSGEKMKFTSGSASLFKRFMSCFDGQ